jgi:hypothetical protein
MSDLDRVNEQIEEFETEHSAQVYTLVIFRNADGFWSASAEGAFSFEEESYPFSGTGEGSNLSALVDDVLESCSYDLAENVTDHTEESN